jgi:Domain of unknown function (DUF1929)/Glyoxal oxidase N-terminus
VKYKWPDVAIHLHLLPESNTDRALLLSYSDDNSPTGRYGGSSKSYVVSIPIAGAPATSWLSVPNTTTNLFCSGHTFLPDGRLLEMGGHIDYNYYGDSDVNVFSYGPPCSWQLQITALNAGRWYPSVISLPNREVLIVAGNVTGSNTINDLPQVWQTDAGGGMRDLTTARLKLKNYPRVFVIPDGRVASVGAERMTRYLKTSDTGSWSNGPTRKYVSRVYGSAVLYDDGKIMMAGGAETVGSAPTNTAEVLDLNSGNAWRWTNPMHFARKHANATLLPDGTVLVTGGSSSQIFNDAAGSTYAAELWDPATEQWTLLASAAVPRVYHSTAILLPDGRVLSAGGGRPKAKNGGTNNLNAEIFSPPYLFKGRRPTVTAAAATADLGAEIEIATPDAADIKLVTALRLGSVTHAFNMNQRINRLPFTVGAGHVTARVPSDRNRMLPGHYLLFVLNNAGVPSIGRVIGIATG